MREVGSPALPRGVEVFEPSRLSRVLDRVLPWLVRGLTIASAVFLVAPLVAVVGTAFNEPPVIAFPPQRWTLDAFRAIPPNWYGALLFSAELALLSALIAGALTLPAAFALARGRLPGRALIEIFLQGPLQVPQIVMAVGLFQYYVLMRSRTDSEIFGKFAGLLAAHVLLVSPYMLATLLGRVATIDRALEEAAEGLGAGPVRILFRILLPLLRPALVAAMSLAVIISFDNVTLSLFLTTGASTTTLPVTLFNAIELSASPNVFAAATLAVLFSLIATLTIERVVGLRTVVGR